MTLLVQASPRIEVGPNVHVSAGRATSPHQEVVIAADPNDARRLLACSMLDAGPDRSVRSAAYSSFDGGKTWSTPVVTTAHWANDPTCAFAPNGTAFFVHKVNDGVMPASRVSSDADYLGIHRSSNGGRTWEAMIAGPQTNDRPFMAIDQHNGRMYVAYNGHLHGESGGHENTNFRNTVALLASDDRGTTFPITSWRGLMDQTPERGANAGICGVAALSDGTVIVLYSHMIIETPNAGGARTATGKPTEVAATLRVVRSTDGGRSLDPATSVAEIKSGYNMVNARGVPASLAVDPGSARFKDRLYVAWTDVGSGRAQIRLSSSSDGAQTWSMPAFVNDDSLEAPRAGGAADHFMATVAVNRDGVVGVLWYDRRDHRDNVGYYARFSASLDGGSAWLPSVRVSAAPNDRAAQRDAASFLITGGDTAGLTAASDGRFHALWIDNRTGVQQVWTAPITVRP
jgi:hypothetical protein